jgi:hypothetical protein
MTNDSEKVDSFFAQEKEVRRENRRRLPLFRILFTEERRFSVTWKAFERSKTGEI